MSREPKKYGKTKELARAVCNHPDYLKCGKKGLKKLAKRIEKELKKLNRIRR